MSDQLSNEEIRSLVVEVLSQKHSGQLNELADDVTTVATKKGLVPDPNAQQAVGSGFPGIRISPTYNSASRYHNIARIHNVIWDLIIEGVVRPGLFDGTNNDLPWFHVTEYGKAVLNGLPQTPYDPDNYLKRLQADIQSLDPIIVTYLTEALHTFRIGCLLSSTVMLGCASEKAFQLLLEAYATALPQAQQEKFNKEIQNKLIKRQFDEFNKRLESHLKVRLPGDIKADLDVALTGVFSMIRNMRNDAGHPTGLRLAREVVYANLTVFPTYLKKVYSLIDWLQMNSL